MFCQTIRRVRRAIRMASAAFDGWSVIRTTSYFDGGIRAESPMAAPMSALASTGVSLIPSPTNISFHSVQAPLQVLRRGLPCHPAKALCTSSIPSSRQLLRSALSHPSASLSASRRALLNWQCLASSLISSAITIAPHTADQRRHRRRFRCFQLCRKRFVLLPSVLISGKIVDPPVFTRMPCPGISSYSSILSAASG